VEASQVPGPGPDTRRPGPFRRGTPRPHQTINWHRSEQTASSAGAPLPLAPGLSSRNASRTLVRWRRDGRIDGTASGDALHDATSTSRPTGASYCLLCGCCSDSSGFGCLVGGVPVWSAPARTVVVGGYRRPGALGAAVSAERGGQSVVGRSELLQRLGGGVRVSVDEVVLEAADQPGLPGNDDGGFVAADAGERGGGVCEPPSADPDREMRQVIVCLGVKPVGNQVSEGGAPQRRRRWCRAAPRGLRARAARRPRRAGPRAAPPRW
jgi:hypothetical protein